MPPTLLRSTTIWTVTIPPYLQYRRPHQSGPVLRFKLAASYAESDQNEWIEKRNMHLYSYTNPVPVLTYYKKLSMFRGVVMVNIYEDQLKQMLESNSSLDQFFIIDSDGNFLLQGRGTEEPDPESKEALIEAVHAASGTPSRTGSHWDAPDIWCGSSADCGTYIAACTSRSSYYQALYTLLLQLFIVLAVIICTVVWIAYTITKRTFSRLITLSPYFPMPSGEPIIMKNRRLSKMNMTLILNNIVQLFINQTFLKNKLALKEQEQKLAEMTASSCRSTPHFLFNTLQTLDFKALSIPDAYSLKQNHRGPVGYSQILAPKNTMSMVTLKDEIEYLKKYDHIQQYRYEDKYILYYDYEEELESTPIIRLILQPLIENSLYHGIKPLRRFRFYQVKDHGTG